jgi:carbamoyl-phosphate synthase large subunit
VTFGNDDSRIVQEFLPGQEYVVNLYLARLPENDVVQVFEKTELRDGETGNAVSVRAAHVPDVAVLARTAAAAIGLTGPADVDIRRRADGRPAVLEINARFGAHSARTPAVLDALLAERLGAFT